MGMKTREFLRKHVFLLACSEPKKQWLRELCYLLCCTTVSPFISSEGRMTWESLLPGIGKGFLSWKPHSNTVQCISFRDIRCMDAYKGLNAYKVQMLTKGKGNCAFCRLMREAFQGSQSLARNPFLYDQELCLSSYLISLVTLTQQQAFCFIFQNVFNPTTASLTFILKITFVFTIKMDSTIFVT